MTGPAGVYLIATLVVVFFAVSYILLLVASNRRIIQEQQRRLDELQRSEQRYKALFDTSIAGMMKFSVSPFIVFETNRTVLDMFNAKDDYELQRVLSDLPHGQTQMLESMLKSAGTVEAFELSFETKNGIKRRFLLSARREQDENVVHGVVILMTAERVIG